MSDPLPAEATVGSLGERALIRRLRARIPAGAGVLLGPGDDAALVATGAVTIVTTDALVEGVHFRRDWSSARRVGRKALSVNLSDVGAMAGRARYATLSLCLPAALEVAWLDRLYDGLLERAQEAGVALVGGNISATSGPAVIDVAVLGESVRPLLREGWRLSDDGVAAAPAGGAASDPRRRACLAAQLDPDPPLAFAAALATFDGVHAGMDISDGLSGDLASLCAESAVAAVVDLGALPMVPGSGVAEAHAHALHGGEDYQLLLAADPGRVDALRALAHSHATRISVIGSFEPGPPAVWALEGRGRRPLPAHAHEHFAAGGPPA